MLIDSSRTPRHPVRTRRQWRPQRGLPNRMAAIATDYDPIGIARGFEGKSFGSARVCPAPGCVENIRNRVVASMCRW